MSLQRGGLPIGPGETRLAAFLRGIAPSPIRALSSPRGTPWSPQRAGHQHAAAAERWLNQVISTGSSASRRLVERPVSAGAPADHTGHAAVCGDAKAAVDRMAVERPGAPKDDPGG